MEQSYVCQAHLFRLAYNRGNRLLISMLYSLEGFQQGKTQIYVYGISVTFAVFVGWRQILRLERIIVYKLQRFLQYSMLYISWRNAYLYRDMNHTVYIGHFSTIHINPYTHNHALTHANFTCKFMWQSEY